MSGAKTVLPAQEIYDLDCVTRENALQELKKSMKPPPKDDAKSWWYRTAEKLAASKGITIKSKQGLFTFGVGLADDELASLYTLIKRKLTRG